MSEEEDKGFDLVLVNIKQSWSDIRCVKKNMYDPDLKYVAISYRWGEINEQIIKTPDYTAHITSFQLSDLIRLCEYIKREPDLKEVPYLWIDAISVDQYDHLRKKDTVLKMNQIYQKATFILAVPDLHMSYLKKHPANKETIKLIEDKYKETIYNEIFNIKHSSTDSINDDNESPITISTQPMKYIQRTNDKHDSIIQKLANKNLIKENDVLRKEGDELKKKVEELKKEVDELKIKNKNMEMKMEKNNEKMKKNQEMKKIYQFLAYLIEDWSNRAWVISEYHTAKENYMKKTPLKYWFISLHCINSVVKPFFSYRFDNESHDKIITKLTCKDVHDAIILNLFLKERFMQRSHLDMMLNSNATRNEDRFNAILPSWNEHKNKIEDRNTVSRWNITDMTSVRLKLYEIINNDDLWDKAILLHACSASGDVRSTILPSFASYYDMDKLMIVEKYNYNDAAYKKFEGKLLDYIKHFLQKDIVLIKQLINEYKMSSKRLWAENLINIQLVNLDHLSLEENSYFIKWVLLDDYWRSILSLDHRDDLYEVFIPFFTFEIPLYSNYPHIYKFSSSICLIGNKKKNRWVLTKEFTFKHQSEHFRLNNYTFNIY